MIDNDIGIVLGLAQYETGGCRGKDWVSFSKQTSQCSENARQFDLVVADDVKHVRYNTDDKL